MTTPQAQLLVAVNGGSPQTGAIPCNFADTLAFSAGTSALFSQLRYEIYSYPVGFACPAGWSIDLSTGGTGTYFFASPNPTTTPPLVTLPASGPQNWGFFMFRLQGNGNPLVLNADGTPNTGFSPSLTDEATCVNVRSPNLQMPGIGFGLEFQFDAGNAWVGPLMESLRLLDALAVGGGNFFAGGDLSGSSISQTVRAVHGATVPVAGALTPGNVLQVSGASALSYGPVNVALAASVTGTLATGNGGTGLATVGGNGTVLTIVAGVPAWAAPAGAAFVAGGDLGGTSTLQNVLAVHGASVPLAGSLVTGNVLQVTGLSALGYAPISLANAASVSGVLPAANQAPQTLAGDVTGLASSSVVARINGATLPAAGGLTVGNILQVASSNSLTYGPLSLTNPASFGGVLQPVNGGTGLGALGAANQLLGMNAGGTALAYFTPTGDVTLAGGAFAVVALQGFGVATSAPTSGQVLTWNAGTSKWTATAAGGGSSVTGSGIWHSTSGSLDGAASKGTAGQFSVTGAGATDTGWASISADVSASTTTPGALTVVALQGHAVASTGPTEGQFLIQGASSWGPVSLSLDVSASAVTPGAITVIGLKGNAVPTPASGYLQWTGSAFAWTSPGTASVTGSGFWHSTAGTVDGAASKGTAGQFAVTNAGATDAVWASLSIDVTNSTGTAGGINVVGLRGNPIANVAATAGQVLIENAAASGSAWTSFSQDVLLSTTTPGQATVAGLKGSAVPTLSAGFLQWTGSAFAWGTPSGAFSAGTDLSGSNTAQTVIGFQGRVVAATAPSNGQVYVWNSGASQWQPATPSGGVSVTSSGFWHSSAGTLDGAASKGTAGQFAATSAGATDAGWVTLSGDVSASTTTVGKLTNTGLQGVAVPTLTAGLLHSTGSVLNWSKGTAGQALFTGAGATDIGWATLTQDVTASTTVPGQLTVAGLHGTSLGALSAGYLHYNGSALVWDTPPGVLSLVFQPGGTAGGNVYTSWSLLFAAAGTLQGSIEVFIDGTHNGNAATIPSGAWGFTNADVTFRGPFDAQTIVTCAAGSTIGGVARFEDMTLQTAGTSPVIAITSGVHFLEFNDVSVLASSTGPFIAVSGASTAVTITLVNGSDFGDGVHAALTAGAGSSLSVSLTVASTMEANSITGAGTLQVTIYDVASTNLSAVATTLGTVAANLAYDDTLASPTIGATDVQAALDYFKTHSVVLGGDLGGTSTAQTVIGLQGRSVATTAPTSGQALVWNSGTSKWTPTTVASGGSVTGSGFWHATSGTLDGAASKGSAGQFAVTTASAADAGWASLSLDVSASTVTPGALTVNGLKGNAVPTLSAGFLQWTGSAFAWGSPAGGFVAGTDLSGTNTAQTVVAIQNHGIATAAPTSGQALVWNSGTSKWTPTSLASATVSGSGFFHATSGSLDGTASKGTAGQFAITAAGATDTGWASLSLDVSASTTTPGAITVTGIQGNAVPSLATGFLNWSGTAFAWLAATAITQLTGDVHAGPGTGSVASTVVAISGASPIPITPNVLQWTAGTTTPTLTQLQPATDVASVTMLIQAQSAHTGATTNKNGAQLSLLGGAPAAGGLSGGAIMGTPDGLNIVGANAGNGIRLFSSINYTIGTAISGITGVGVVAISNAGTIPTSVPTNGASIYGNGGSLEIATGQLQFARASAGPTITQATAAAGINAGQLSISGQDGGSGNTAGGSLVLSGGAASGTGTTGNVTIQSGDGNTGIIVGPAAIAILPHLASGGNTLFNAILSPSGGEGLLVIGNAPVKPTSVLTTGIYLYAVQNGSGVAPAYLETSANFFTFHPGLAGVTVGQFAAATNTVGGDITLAAQAGGTGGTTDGGNAWVTGAPGHGGGTMGGAAIATPDKTTALVTATSVGATMEAFLSGGVPGSLINVGNGVILAQLNLGGSGLVTQYLLGPVAGLVNTQVMTRQPYFMAGRVSSSGGTVVATVPVPTNGSQARLNVTAQAKVIANGSGTSVGDCYDWQGTTCYVNIGGTCSVVGGTSATPITIYSAAHLASASSVTFGVSGDDIHVTLTVGAGSGTLGTADCALWVDVTYN